MLCYHDLLRCIEWIREEHLAHLMSHRRALSSSPKAVGDSFQKDFESWISKRRDYGRISWYVFFEIQIFSASREKSQKFRAFTTSYAVMTRRMGSSRAWILLESKMDCKDSHLIKSGTSFVCHWTAHGSWHGAFPCLSTKRLLARRFPASVITRLPF